MKTKLDGRARGNLVADDTTTDAIIAKLQANIKPDNSKVLAGRILSLKLNYSEQTDLADKAEKLSEAFRRSLVIEGMSQEKATEMAIEKTIELCRSNACILLFQCFVFFTAKFDSFHKRLPYVNVQHASGSK